MSAALLLVLLLLLILSTACEQAVSRDVDGHVVLVPRVLRSGEPTSFSVSLLAGEQPAQGEVAVRLRGGGKDLAQATGTVAGSGTVEMPVPELDEGEYQVVVNGPGFEQQTDVQVQSGALVFLETDKPIYKPGQRILMRVLALDSELKPRRASATVEVQDAKGVKVFREEVATDEYGMATLELPLSEEPNLGVWKLQVHAGDARSELDVSVEEYVLPKFGVEVELDKSWFLVDEPLEGVVSAEYSYGRPVSGELQVTATRYVGAWEEFATFTAPLDGRGEFSLDPAGYVAGVPEAGGMGNVQLEVTVREQGTGYEETTTELVTVAAAPLNIRLIPESPVFKPHLGHNVLVVTETPDGEPVEAAVELEAVYMDESYEEVGREQVAIETDRGLGLARLEPVAGAVRLQLTASSGEASAFAEQLAAYSPSDSFVHVEQVDASEGALSVGDTARFAVAATGSSRTFYYEVVARGRSVFSGTAEARPDAGDERATAQISLPVTPAMAPSARLLVYQVLPTTEVAADALPFEVTGEYPQSVEARFDAEEVRPGDAVGLEVTAEAPSKIGLVAVDRSVFLLAENRLNLQQVFAELERLYRQPQAELHEGSIGPGPLVDPAAPGPDGLVFEQALPGVAGAGTRMPGAEETFADAGMIVLSDREVPEGKDLPGGGMIIPEGFMVADGQRGEADMALAMEAPATAATALAAAGGEGLAEVQRVRQFFPETWLWEEGVTDETGRLALDLEAPDSITTWDLRAVALSPERGLGVGEASVRVFQPFFLSADLPYSCIRGEEFPVEIALYNYMDEPQEIVVEVEDADWFDLRDEPSKTVTVAANDVGSVSFTISPRDLGTQVVRVTARSGEAADAVQKGLIVEAEGVAQEQVQNAVLSAGAGLELGLSLPQPFPIPGEDVVPGQNVVPGQSLEAPPVPEVVPDSARAYVALSGSLLAQTIDGLDGLIQMPFGCGEQNMLLFAPDTYILRYLEETGQLKPEIQAKAEGMLVTGYQRELTYRRADGSFSAFGDSDPSGSLFLTAFVMKTFAQASDLIFVDDAVLAAAADWVEGHQQADGSFEAVGFVSHQELLGGVQGKDALTAYAAVALLEAGHADAADRALAYLAQRLPAMQDGYALALTSYALTLGDHPAAEDARGRLKAAAREDDDGLYWEATGAGPEPLLEEAPAEPFAPAVPGLLPPDQVPGRSAAIEATGYATLALTAGGDLAEASRAARWLVAHRNSLGGFGSTQDTVVALQALSEYAAVAAEDSDLTVVVSAGDTQEEVRIDATNFDVTQVVEVPAGAPIRLEAEGEGQAVVQGVLRYNVTQVPEADPVFDITVDYDTTEVAVNDLVRVDVSVAFDPPEPVLAGMVVVDVAVPTGFEAVDESLQALVDEGVVKRYDVAGRKVILYIEDMAPGDRLDLAFEVRARYPVVGKGGVSRAYSYYTPEWRGSSLDDPVVVRGS